MMWKKIGKDAEKNRANPIVEAMREQMFHYDLFIATSEEYADHIRTGFGKKDEELIRAGQPRNSLFFQPEKTEECRKKLTERLKIPDGRFLCYLPTLVSRLADPGRPIC
jgi:CDP-glycerol glycerophosphotransferase (TagB/SpsB family)